MFVWFQTFWFFCFFVKIISLLWRTAQPRCLHPLRWDHNRVRLSPRRCAWADTEPNPDFTPIHGNLVGGREEFSTLAEETLPHGRAVAAPALRQAPLLGTSAPSFTHFQPAPGAAAAGWTQDTGGPSWVLRGERSPWRGAALGCKIIKSRRDRECLRWSSAVGRQRGERWKSLRSLGRAEKHS